MSKGLQFDATRLAANASGKKMKSVRMISREREAVEVPLDLIDPYEDLEGHSQPFQMYGEEEMAQMVESVKEMGVLTPVLLRPMGERYQTLAGHNRIEAARRAGLTTVPGVIRDCDDNDAAIAVVDTNLQQRQHLLPSERAKAYKVKADAIGRKQGQRSDLAGGQKQDRAQLIAEQSKESKRNVYRYLLLNDLLPSLLERVDAKGISVEAGGFLASLSKSEQQSLEQVITAEKMKKITPKQAEELAEHAKGGDLDQNQMRVILGCAKKPQPKILTIKICVEGQIEEQAYQRLEKRVKLCSQRGVFAQHLLQWLQQELGE